jgi:hypothetical protein
MNKVAILAMIYHEVDWLHTCAAIARLNRVPTFFADRQGINGLAGAFNGGFDSQELGRFEYVWFLTNVHFHSIDFWRLVDAMDANPEAAAIQPAYQSDHKHLRSDGSGLVRSVPFIEFTCPMVRSEVFRKYPLDPGMPYTGHDVDWSFRVLQAGWMLGVHNQVMLDHKYLRHLPDQHHPSTRERARLRKLAQAPTEARLADKYGSDWRTKLNYHGGI